MRTRTLVRPGPLPISCPMVSRRVYPKLCGSLARSPTFDVEWQPAHRCVDGGATRVCSFGAWPFKRWVTLCHVRSAGDIPASIDQLMQLEKLDLSDNQLSGACLTLVDATSLSRQCRNARHCAGSVFGRTGEPLRIGSDYRVPHILLKLRGQSYTMAHDSGRTACHRDLICCFVPSELILKNNQLAGVLDVNAW